jgi:ATP-dependent Clp protease ATP-binding subunit ClpC
VGVFERFTERARQVVVLAQEEARTLKHNYIGTEHLLLGLLREEDGLAASVLRSLDVTVERVRAQVVFIVGAGEEVPEGQVPFTPRAKKVLEMALREALSLSVNYIGTEHILLGLTFDNEGVAAQILLDFDADSETIRHAVIGMLSGSEAPAQVRSTSVGWRPGPEPIDQAWFDGVGGALSRLAAEIRYKLKREPDSGDLLLILASAPASPVARILRELGVGLDELPGVVERIRAQALSEDELAQQIQRLTGAKQQAIADVTRLAAQERELREQVHARDAVEPEALTQIRRQLGLPEPADTPPEPPQPS